MKREWAWLGGTFLACFVASVLGSSLRRGDAPRYCDECRAIRELQARPHRTAPEDADLERLKRDYQRGALGQVAYDEQAGRRLPDLHPDVACDCPCHVAIR